MVEFPNYIAMDPEEYHYKRAVGVVQMGSTVDHIRQPGVVGMYGGRKPVFIWTSPAEEAAFMAGDIERIFEMRNYKRTMITNKNPEGIKITIP